MRPGAEIAISAREAEVLAALAEHLTNAEIAARLVISVRTVESHVSSLLRKLGVPDRRALAAAATTTAATPGPGAAPPPGGAAARLRLPVSLTSFVGRRAELADVAGLLAVHRLVTAVGPGGVGKTRLAVRAAEDVAGRFADGAWFVDLVPVADASMLPAAVAAAIGLGDSQARTALDTVLAWLAAREALLVLDNGEHLLDGLAVLLERLLTACPRVTVLVTSRARLLLPYERVFAVPGLSLGPADGVPDRPGDPGDAVALFVERAAAGGVPVAPGELARVAEICRRLDGTALAVELAAARLPSLGLDGVEAGLADRLNLLRGGSRLDDRHRSLRSTLDWSHDLLAPDAAAVLRRISVFAGAVAPAAAERVAGGWPPVPAGAVAVLLGELADHSLLLPTGGAAGTAFVALESVRQYGADRLADAEEQARAHEAHLAWCLGIAADLAAHPEPDSAAWRVAFDDTADELRAALGRATSRPAASEVASEGASEAASGPVPGPPSRPHGDAFRLALLLADLAFDRGLLGESQRRYEQAAGLSDDPAEQAAALHRAAGAAEVRFVGTQALHLRRAAARAALRGGDRAGAATELARAAELVNRGIGLMEEMATDAVAGELLDAARPLAGDDDGARTRVLVAEAFRAGGADPATAALARQAHELARRAGDPLAESAALDALTLVQLTQADVGAAVASTRRRLELLGPVRMTAASGMELGDAYSMAVDCAIGAGDLDAARELARRSERLPFHREEAHLTTARLLLVAALAGDLGDAVDLGERYLEGWERAGRPRASSLARGAYAMATVHGLRGDAEERRRWLDVAADVTTRGRETSQLAFARVLDGTLLLHRGLPGQARELLASARERRVDWHEGLWRMWYLPLWAESAVLAGTADAADLVAEAAAATSGSAVGRALTGRAAALLAGDDAGLRDAARALAAAGCRYQWARTLSLLPDPDRREGTDALTRLGATVPGAVR